MEHRGGGFFAFDREWAEVEFRRGLPKVRWLVRLDARLPALRAQWLGEGSIAALTACLVFQLLGIPAGSQFGGRVSRSILNFFFDETKALWGPWTEIL